ncbi:hypothetical protein IAR55_000822 [Kwoniella newhampshirensis]|uniref:Uncharacterized protein n=1 Tax=Kwoniella newhampshirensis TaxID=1651941 RepID=A0AAW0Z413_9TREE
MSYGTSPTAPSLLIPPNPAFVSPDLHPRGGILINVHRNSEPSHIYPLETGSSSFSASSRRISEPGSPITPVSATFSGDIAAPPASLITTGGAGSSSPFPSPDLSAAHMSPKPPKIRFAPLPDPRRPRSLSTGRNIAWTTTIGEDGEQSRRYEIKGMDDDFRTDEDEEDEEGEEGEDGGNGGHKRGRSWSKTMGSSWKGTKKLLSGKNPVKEKEKEEDSLYGTNGAPLKKSVSTGGFIGSSPFRWTAETERRKSMQGPPPASVTSLLSARRPEPTSSSSMSALAPTSPGHRRNSSLEPTTTSSAIGASPTPVKMLNGRVYGSRRASEAAEREKVRRERMEPAFVEWGSAGVGATLESSASGSASGTTGRRSGFLGDDDDGGGMAWVKKRREERQRREEEERQKKALKERQLSEAESATEVSPTDGGAGLSSSHSSASSLDISGGAKPSLGINTTLKTPAIAVSELPPTPIIHVSESSPVVSTRTTMSDDTSSAKGIPVGSIIKSNQQSSLGENEDLPPTPVSATSAKMIEENDTGHVVQAMRIPSDSTRKGPQTSSRGPSGNGMGRDVFGDEDVSPTRGNARVTSESEEDEDDEEDEEEEDDGDFEDDDDEEEDAVRTTSSAAGVEVISRHKN